MKMRPKAAARKRLASRGATHGLGLDQTAEGPSNEVRAVEVCINIGSKGKKSRTPRKREEG